MTKNRYDELLTELKKYDSLAVAYSGGVDSTLLVKAAKDALNDKAVAITIKSEFVPLNEFEEATTNAREIGI
ncbi:MAG: TIGR00268 family protein, partial [Selenomonadaceae bacterium]|nr:TIGR00268 family protein [Selenomonadaceae bacterium]